MIERTPVLILATFIAAGALVGCSATGDRGAMESAGATAGRVMDDSVITGKVKSALIADPTTKAMQIEVETYEGRVQLSGFVDSEAARERAVEIARNVEGVKEVQNSMQLRNRG